ncbi:hypothetical protein LINPERHAP1_LOCUS3233 [Linum perenne]
MENSFAFEPPISLVGCELSIQPAHETRPPAESCCFYIDDEIFRPQHQINLRDLRVVFPRVYSSYLTQFRSASQRNRFDRRFY